MNMLCIILKIRAPLFILSTVVTFVEAIYCPPYCKCSVTNQLKHVKCSGQKLINVELDIPTRVEWLELSNNYISLLRDNIFQDLGFERIIVLNLNNNAINEIGLNAFKGLKYIKFIDLSGNHLYKLDAATFENNPSLEHLILSSNPLRSIPYQRPFLISNSLQNLEISQCRFSYFPPDSFAFLPSLNHLNISNNDILMLHENLLNSLTNLKELDISNTAIKCDPSSTFLLSWASEKSARIIGSPCSPSSITDKFNQLNNEQPKKFEKMIMPPDTSSEINDYDSYYDEEYYKTSECRCPEIIENFDETSVKTSTIRPTETTERRKFSQHDYRSMVWLAFLNGLIIGAALSISTILFWIYCCKYRYRANNRRRRQRPALYDNIPNDTPPPSYNDLFLESS
uniref:Putative toll-like receptor 4 isoform x2 n=1 Tax=Panstrongylus lignarius TaxID=156445 RepID=A0A224XQ64_9HEMI